MVYFVITRFIKPETIDKGFMHYYQFNIGDYASHTRHLDLLEDLAYRRILDLYYLHESPLENLHAFVAKKIGMKDYVDVVECVLAEFFVLTDEGWTNPRADKEIAHYKAKVEQASRAGKASAERRFNGRSTDRTTDVQPNKNQEPRTNKQEPIKDTQALPATSPDFTFDKFVEQRKEQGLSAIIESDPVWEVIDSLGMPDDFAELQWRYLESQYSAKKGGKAKRYKQWPLVLKKSLAELWGQLFFKSDQGWVLTSKGKNLRELAA